MNPCPHCNQPVLEMAEKCRHCGQEIDEATFFMNESAMMEEIQALQKQTKELQEQKLSLQKQFKLSSILAFVLLILGGGLVALTTHVLQGLGALCTVLGVVSAFLALRARRKLEELNG